MPDILVICIYDEKRHARDSSPEFWIMRYISSARRQPRWCVWEHYVLQLLVSTATLLVSYLFIAHSKPCVFVGSWTQTNIRRCHRWKTIENVNKLEIYKIRGHYSWVPHWLNCFSQKLNYRESCDRLKMIMISRNTFM